MNTLLTLIFTPLLLIWNLSKKKEPGKNKLPPDGTLFIVAAGGIGDTLLAFPAVKTLKKSFPALKITVWTDNPKTGEFFQDKELVDSLVYYPFGRFFSPLSNFLKNWAFMLEMRRKKFSSVLIMEPCQNIISALMGFFSGAKIRVGPRYRLGKIDGTDFLLTDSLPFSYEKHVVQMNLDLARLLGAEDVSSEFNLSIPDREKKIAESLLKENGLSGAKLLVGMHIGANSNQLYKCWNPEKFAEISDFLVKEYEAKVLITGGEGEKSQVGKMLRLTEPPPVNLVGKLGILETLALLEQCDLFISNDSGPMHMAAAAGTPVVAIFGPTRPQKNEPYGPHALVRKKMDCSPCYDWKFSRIDPCDHLKCMSEISTEDVKSAVRTILNKSR